MPNLLIIESGLKSPNIFIMSTLQSISICFICLGTSAFGCMFVCCFGGFFFVVVVVVRLFVFWLFRAVPASYRSSVGAAAASLHHSHSNVGLKQCLRPT